MEDQEVSEEEKTQSFDLKAYCPLCYEMEEARGRRIDLDHTLKSVLATKYADLLDQRTSLSKERIAVENKLEELKGNLNAIKKKESEARGQINKATNSELCSLAPDWQKVYELPGYLHSTHPKCKGCGILFGYKHLEHDTKNTGLCSTCYKDRKKYGATELPPSKPSHKRKPKISSKP